MTVEDIYRHFNNFLVIIEDDQETLYLGRLNNTPTKLMNKFVYSVDIFRLKSKDDFVLSIFVS